MVFDQQQFETALQQVEQHLLVSVKPPKIGQVQKVPLYIFETIPSTNQKLWELLNQGAKTNSVVIASQQTAGRGQWGRQWQSSMGGLYLSLALALNLPASSSAQLTLCSAWGIATALRAYDLPVSIKWPNDLILKGRKLGGILTETRVQQGQITTAVVGIGINWSNAVPEPGINLQSFVEKQLSPIVTSLEHLAAITLQGWHLGYQHWSEKGIEILLESYLELLDSQGNQVIVDGNPGVITGVTPTGELRVCLNSTATVVGGSAPDVAAAKSKLMEIYLKPGTISLGYHR